MRHELTLFHELLTFFTSARGLIAAESSVSSGGLPPPSGSPPLGAVSLPLVRWAERAVPGTYSFAFQCVRREEEFGTT